MSDYHDIGGGCSISFTANHDGERFGLFLKHPPGPNAEDWEREQGYCSVHVPFKRSESKAPTQWTVESMEPLTLSPSIVCSCGAHGWIRDGKWVPA